MTSTDRLLEIRDLSISFPVAGRSNTNILKNVSLTLNKGEILGVVGESGSGKSLTSLATLGLLPDKAIIDSGEIIFRTGTERINILGQDSERKMMKIRGNRISMIFQEPMTSLNPVQKCGDQVYEVLRIHHGAWHNEQQSKNKVLELFEKVDLPRPEDIYSSYPHQISGGQKQRVMIAMAIACEPDIIIADEPSTALDVTVQKSIIQLLKRLCKKQQKGLIFISHDLGVIAEIADRIMVIYKGMVMEEGDTRTILTNPSEPYTNALLACRPKLEEKPLRLPTVSDFMDGEKKASTPIQATKVDSHEVILEVIDASVEFKINRKGSSYKLKALDRVSFQVYKGETLGLVGESGCGKSTLGRSIVGLQNLHYGRINYQGQPLVSAHQKFPKTHRRKIQMIFQDPYSSLNPGMTVGEALEEPLIIGQEFKSKKERKEKVRYILDRVGLPLSSMNKYPHQFSGGQRQRIGIARALMLSPKFIICDESVSALDVSVQAKVLNLLNDLKDEFGLTYIFISHDLSVVKYMSDRLMVMRMGQMEEMGDSDEVYKNPQSAYTKTLLEAIPKI